MWAIARMNLVVADLSWLVPGLLGLLWFCCWCYFRRPRVCSLTQLHVLRAAGEFSPWQLRQAIFDREFFDDMLIRACHGQIRIVYTEARSLQSILVIWLEERPVAQGDAGAARIQSAA